MAWSNRDEYLFVHNLDCAVEVYKLHEESRLLHLFIIQINEKTFLPKALALAFDETALIVGGDSGKIRIFELKDFKKVGSLEHGSSILFSSFTEFTLTIFFQKEINLAK
jgi:hypothetical protein